MRDIQLDTSFDLVIKNGDFSVGESTQQHQQCLLLAEKGSYKQYPTVGVGIATYLKDDSPSDLLREIRIQFSKDGMNVNSLGFEQGKLRIDAPYGNRELKD